MAVVAIVAVLLRITVIPRMKDEPKGIQNILEIAVDGVSDYPQANQPLRRKSQRLYIHIMVFMAASAFVELFGFVRLPPILR